MHEQIQDIRVRITSDWLRRFIRERGSVLNVATRTVIVG
jgi:hypothetical protein